jgi:Uncharacterized conserved protein
MCYHNTLETDEENLKAFYEAEFDEPDLFTSLGYVNGFTHPKWPVFNQHKKLVYKYWGLIPSWVKDATQARTMASRMLNARAETLFEKTSFKKAIQQHRCLIPSTGFVEWQTEGKKKLPYFISLIHQSLFSMGGIAESWFDPETGECVETFSIITTSANPLMARIHNTQQRMPLILDKTSSERWLDASLTREQIVQLCIPFPEQLMQVRRIAKADYDSIFRSDALF